jgi:hypothetical protein
MTEALEELAEEWNMPKTIKYPISATNIKVSRAGLFSPLGDVQYDLMANIEMYIIRTSLLGIILVPMARLKKH